MTELLDPGFVFKALGDATRLKILELLKKPGPSSCDLISPGEKVLCACDIQEKIGLSQTTISHHLDILRRAGLIRAEKRGRWMIYRRNGALMKSIAEILRKAI